MSWQFQNLRWKFVAAALVAFSASNIGVANAAQPGELVEWKVSPDSPVVIKFRYCPAGTIRPAKPSDRPVSPENALPPVDVRDFYIGETEVTLGQFRGVVGDAGMAPLIEHAEKIKGTNPKLLEAIQKGQTEPALFVSVDDAVDFCNRLQSSLEDARIREAQPSIETRIFRLPTHVEWQYAARAISAADSQSKLPHFMRWIKFADLSPANQEKCKEVWTSLGHLDQFPDTQEAFFELTRWTDSAQGEKVKQILTEAFAKAFGSPQRSASGIGALVPVGGTAANDWNLNDIHEGVSEWTIWSPRTDRTRDLWTRFSTARKNQTTLAGQEEFFLCGGSFVDSYFGTKALGRFTLWGGPKLSGEQPQPISYTPEIVLDNMPGFRVVMERTMADNWMQVLRKSVFKERQLSPATVDYIRSNRPVVEELTDAEHPSRIAIELYTELATRTEGGGKLPEVLNKVAKMKSASGPAESTSSKLSNFFKKPAAEKSPDADSGSDDGAYFQQLAELVGQ